MRGTLLFAVTGLLAGAPAVALDPPPKQASPKPVTVSNRSAVVSPPPAMMVPKPAEARDGSTGPMPIGSPGEWVLSEDYPKAALHNNVQGTVKFTLEVDSEGSPEACVITDSSGDESLDSAACDRLMERARFLPARDAEGNAMPGTWSNSVRWVLPRRRPVPAESWLVTWVIVEKDGSVSSCEVERAEGAAAKLGEEACSQDMAFQPILDDDGEPVRSRVRYMMRVVHEPLP